MFFIKKIIIISTIFITILIFNNKEKENIVIPDNAIRFRIIANSNNSYDLKMKEMAKEEIKEDLVKIKGESASETRKKIINNKENLKKRIERLFEDNNYKKDVDVIYGMNYFPKKKYKGLTYKEGKYESLVIKIGEAKGDNFWCVLYPPLCMIDEEKIKKKEYKFFIKEIILKYK